MSTAVQRIANEGFLPSGFLSPDINGVISQTEGSPRESVASKDHSEGNTMANHWHDTIYDLTPVQNIGGMFFKRDDLFSPDSHHNGSKFRQLIWMFSRAKFPGVVSGAGSHSPQTPMVAACAKHYGMECIQIAGTRKGMIAEAEKLGGKTILLEKPPFFREFVNTAARNYSRDHGFLHIPTYITTEDEKDVEPFHAVGAEQVRNLPDSIRTLIVPAGSRNSVTSVLYGLHKYPKPLDKIILLNIHPNLAKNEKWMWERLNLCGVKKDEYNIETHDVFANGYTNYSKSMPFNFGSLVMHPTYEGKCWNFIKDNLNTFRPYINDKSCFWIIGGPIA